MSIDDASTDDFSKQNQIMAQLHFQRLLKQIPNLPERKTRYEILGEFICSIENEILLELLNIICSNNATTTKHAILFLALQDQPNANNKLSYEQQRQLYELAHQKNYEKVKRLFLSFSPAKKKNPPPAGHHKLAGLTLGTRKFLARKHDIYLLEKLLLDPDPTVIRNLLKNPRITEKEVLYICTRRPNNAEVLKEVATHPQWFKRYFVKLSLCKNPYTPVPIVTSALPFLSIQDLKEIQSMKNLHPQILIMTKEILQTKI